MVDKEYYKRVKTSDEFYRRKKLILANLDKLQSKVEKQAKNYDDYAKLKFIVLQKAGQKQSVLKNFWKLESYNRQSFEDPSGEPFNEEHLGDDFEELYGVENDFSRELKDKINKSK